MNLGQRFEWAEKVIARGPSGMSLEQAVEFCTANRARVTFESDPDNGNVVWVEFPFRPGFRTWGRDLISALDTFVQEVRSGSLRRDVA